MKRTCKQCGKEYILTQQEIDFYNSKGLDLPKRCKECRELNKKQEGKKQESDHPKANNQKANSPQQNVSEPTRKKSNKFTIAAALIILVLAICFPSVRNLIFATGNSNDNEAVNTVTTESTVSSENSASSEVYGFRKKSLLEEHYEKHGVEMGFATAEEYEQAAIKAATNPSALHKYEKEDNDHVYYVEDTNEFVIVSKDGYIRTYFNPDDGIAYFNRQ